MIKILHELRRARGSNKKLEILREHADNEQWLQFLTMVYDPYINYHVSAPNENTYLDPDEDIDYTDMFLELNALIFRHVKGNALRSLAKQMSRQYGEIFRLILKGSINAGVSTKTINKAYPDHIQTFDVMLAQDAPIEQFPVFSSIKYDGVRCLAFVKPEGVTIRLRSGLELELGSLQDIMELQEDGVYDGELVHGNGLQAGRTKITGQVNKVLKGTESDIAGYTFCVFDHLTLEEWENKDNTRAYYERYHSMLINSESCDGFLIVPQHRLKSNEEVEEHFAGALHHGYEGIIIRYFYDEYVWHRSPALIKKKATKTATLNCVDVTEGTNKYEGMIGALVCEGVVEGKVVQVKVGTGLTDEDRDGEFVGKRVEVEYNDVVIAENADHYSLFLPRYKRIVGGI